MKKIMTLFAAAVIAGAAWAHTNVRVMPNNRALPQKQEVSVKPNFEVAKKQAPAVNTRLGVDIAKNFVAKSYSEMPKQARRAAMEETQLLAGYLNPEGSYFCGIDRVGSYMWVNFPTIIGSWLNGYDAWVWPNIAEGATIYDYQNALGLKIPMYKDMANTIDEYGNWVDTLPIMYKGNPDYLFSYRVPAQYASNGTTVDTFVINQPYNNRLDTTIKEMLTLGGTYNFMSDDGMWPLTKAMFFDLDMGFTMSNVWRIDSTQNEVEYILGSSKVTDSKKDSKGQDSTVVYKPAAFVQVFEKPMSTLYIHDVTMAISAYEYNAKSGQYTMCAPTFDTLALMIMSLDMSKAFCASIATINDTTNMKYIPGALVNFKIETEDEFGEKTIGVAIDEPYIVSIMGLNREGNNFGIYTDINLLTYGSTYVVDQNNPNMQRYYPGDPFIMFNGVMNTLEDGHKAWGYESIGDTVDINVEEVQGMWLATYAEGEMEGYIPLVAATDLLYDTTTLEYLYEIESPDWVEFEMNLSDDVWEEYGVYYLYIFGDATNTEVEAPKVGDEIIFSQYGKKLVYRVVSAPTGLNEVKYINDGKRYDVLGKEVDENYKGVVIRNGKKMLQ